MNAVGIDVSKGKSMVAALRPMGEVALLPQEFLHTEVGLEQMAYAIIALGEDTRVIMEATGRYHEPVAAALHEYGIYVCVLNPLFIKQSGGGSIRKVKTDKADAMKIAKYGLDNWVDLREYTPIVIAIALACEPKLILADEPTTALDVTIQAQMLGLIKELQERLNTAMILITHDFGIVAQTCKKVAVMYSGEIVEFGPIEYIFGNSALHPYTKGLFEAIPNIESSTPRLSAIEGMMPDPSIQIEGCRFADRCKHATERCKVKQVMREVEPGHMIRCCLYD